MRLERAENEGFSRPSAEMTFPWDPQLLKNVRRFRDSIRRVMNCQALGLNLKSLFISYYDKETDCKLSVDGFDLRWEKLLDVFNDPNHSEFVIEVRLKCFDLDNPLLKIFEDDIIPVDLAVHSVVESKEEEKIPKPPAKSSNEADENRTEQEGQAIDLEDRVYTWVLS